MGIATHINDFVREVRKTLGGGQSATRYCTSLMSSPPLHNILEDPIAELEAALRAHAFGIDPVSHVLVDQSFPRTDAERLSVASEARSTQQTPGKVQARAKIVLLGKEGEAEVVLDQRGYTVSAARLANSGKRPA